MEAGSAAAHMRAPKQARSQDSTDRMLDAAVTILNNVGLAGLTVAAVSRESGASNGALYHRFGDRRGLLIAAQDRFLTQLEATWLETLGPIWDNPDDWAFLRDLAATFLQIFTQHRRVFHAFMVTGNDDVELRHRGAQTSIRAAQFIADQLTGRFGCSREAAESAYRLLFAQAALAVMFREEEVDTGHLPPDAHIDYLARALAAILG